MVYPRLVFLLIFAVTGCSNSVEEVSKTPTLPIEPPIIEPPPKPLQVSNILPSANATQVEVFEVVRATFSKSLNPATVNEFNIKLFKSLADTLTPIEPQKDNLGNVTGITYEESDHSIVFKPQADLENETDYVVRFLANQTDNFGIKDIEGNILVPNSGIYFTWTFTTKPVPIVAPILQSYAPLSSNIITDMFQPIEINIDETQLSQVPTLDQISISVKLYDSMEWAGNVTYDQQNGIIRFTPTESGWPYNAELRVYASMQDAQTTILDINWYINTRDGVYDPLTVATLTDGNQTTTAKPYTYSVSLFNVVNPINHSSNGNVSVAWVEINDTDNTRKIFTLNNNSTLGWDVPPEEITDPVISVNNIFDLNIVVDSLNNKTAIWYQQDTVGWGLLASRYDQSAAWDTAKKYGIPHNLQSMPPGIAGISKNIIPDNQGNLTVIWGLRAPETSIINLYAARYNQNFNWEATQKIDNNLDSTEILDRIVAASDTNANVSVAWATTNNKAYSTSYIAGNGWQSDINTSPNLLFAYTGNTNIRNYKVLSDKAGNITMFWELTTTNPVDNSFNEDLWGIRFDVDSGWKPPVNIENDLFSNVYFSGENGDTDKKGNATIVWRQSQFIKATRYNNGIGWLSNDLTPAQTIADLGADNAISYSAVSADNGDSFIVWARKTTATTYDLYAKRYDKDTGWESTPVPLFNGYNPNESFNIFYRKADGFGNLTILWSYDNKIFSANYLNGFGWISGDQGYAKNIINLNGPIKKLGLPKAAMDKSGNVTVIWTKEIVSGTSYQVFAKRYNPFKGWSSDEIKLAENLVWTEFFDLGVASSGRVALVWSDKNKLSSAFIE